MVQHVFPSSSLLRCSKTPGIRPRQRLLDCHEGQIKLSFADFHRKIFTIDEDLHEQNKQQLASELREESFDFKPQSPFVDDARNFNEIATPIFTSDALC